MKSLRKIISLAAFIALFMGASGCGLVAKTPSGMQKEVVAKVGSEQITKGEFDAKFAPLLTRIQKEKGNDFANTKEGQDFIKSQKEQYLDQLVQDQLILQKAKELNLMPDDKTIDQKTKELIDNSIKSAGGEDKLKKQIQDNLGMSFDDYKKLVTDYEKVQLAQEKLYDYVTKDIKITDQELMAYYNENLYNYTEKPDKLYFSHILVSTEEQAKQIKKELDGGANFAELAKKYSTDPGSKDNGGEYKQGLEYSQLDKSFLAGALPLPIGKISEPVKTSFGFHIIKVNKKEEYKAKPFEAVKEQVKDQIISQKKPEKFNQAMEDWKKKANVKTYPDKL